MKRSCMGAKLLKTAVLVLIFVAAGSRPARSQPVVGFVEDFTSGIGGFAGVTLDNPGTGGVDGDGDGFMRASRSTALNFGIRSQSSTYAGDYLGAAVTHIRFWLNDVEGDQLFEIHFGIGRNVINGPENFWQYNVPFQPLDNAWSEFEVDLRDSTQFTHTHGSGSFAAAIQDASNILFRHDVPPYTSSSDPIAGELGIDKIQFRGPSPVEPSTWGGIKSIYQ